MTQNLANAAREETLEGVGKLKIFVRSWRPTGQARAVVAICPGFNSHSGYYGWVAEQLTADGFAVTRPRSRAAASSSTTPRARRTRRSSSTKGHYHDLLNDVGKEKVMADIKSWISAHLPRA